MGKASASSRAIEPMALFLATFFLIFLFASSILPMVMQDEFVYRYQAVHLEPSNFNYPNYIFNFLAAFAELFASDFYLVIKAINAGIAALATVLAHRAIAELYGRLIAYVASLAFLSYVALFQSSFYMPDLLLSSALYVATAHSLLALHRNSSGYSYAWAGASVALLIALLAKPHALIFIASLIVFGLAHSFHKRIISPALVVALSALGIRLALGFLIAGFPGLNIFGSSYLESVVSQGTNGSNLVALPQQGLANVANGSVANPFASFFWEFSQIAGAFSLFSLGLVVVVFFASTRSRVASFLALLIATTLGAIALFETWVGITGDNHSDNILMRHVEYLLPLAIAVGLGELAQGHDTFNRWRAKLTALAPIALGAFVVLNLPTRLVSDGGTMLLGGLWGGSLVILIAAVGIGAWLLQSPTRPHVFLFSSVLALSITLLGSLEARDTLSSITDVDRFGVAIAADKVLDGRVVTVVSDNKANAELFRFYSVPLESSQRLFQPGSLVDMAAIEQAEAVFIPLGNIQLQTNCLAKYIEQFVYYDCSNLAQK